MYAAKTATATLPELIHRKGQHHQVGKICRQMLPAVTEVMAVIVLLILERVEYFVLYLPATATHAHDGNDRLGIQGDVGHPAENCLFALTWLEAAVQEVGLHLRVRGVQFQVVHVAKMKRAFFAGVLAPAYLPPPSLSSSNWLNMCLFPLSLALMTYLLEGPSSSSICLMRGAQA